MWSRLRGLARCAVVTAPLSTAFACQSLGGKAVECGPDGCEPTPLIATKPHHEPKVVSDPSMMALAGDLDHLEKHIDWYGSVTAKVPDVWGQARLTRYREEIEEQLHKDLDQFKLQLQGHVARSDQAYLASATALSAAATARGRGAAAPTTAAGPSAVVYANPPIVTESVQQTETVFDKDGNKLKETITKQKPASPVTDATEVAATPAAPEAPKPATLTTDGTKGLLLDEKDAIKRTPVTPVSQFGFGANFETVQIGLEPVQMLAQKKRYLEFLSQLRRTNEGDDTADSPGYALNLMRVPVSVLPGKRTDVGHGAEVTFTATPVLSDELLPATFRGLLTNDLVDQLGFPLTKFLEAEAGRGVLTEENRLVIRHVDDLLRLAATVAIAANEATVLASLDQSGLPPRLIARLRADAVRAGDAARLTLVNETLARAAPRADAEARAALRPALTAGERAVWPGLESVRPLDEPVGNLVLQDKIDAARQKAAGTANTVSAAVAAVRAQPTPAAQFDALKQYQSVLPAAPPAAPAGAGGGGALDKRLDAEVARQVSGLVRRLTDAITGLTAKLTAIRVPFSTGTRGRQAVPASQYVEAFGGGFVFEVAYQANLALRATLLAQGYAHVPDVQAFLKTEIDAAYRLLKNERNVHLWAKYCDQDLVNAVHSRNYKAVECRRDAFRGELRGLAGTSNPLDPDQQPEFSSTAALAWMLIVDAALLTDRLLVDMKETAAAKGVPLPCDAWLHYFVPDPPADAREAFKAYVAARWPVRVFALDPTTDDQNIADTLSVRREVQFALSLAFTSGRMNANQFSRFARRLESEYETIDLNRTQVGFSHGENVFGWRFYPRFQTPPTRGNATVILRDQLLGGPNRNQLHRERRLEAGPRECVALVIMPSFVPYVTLDVTTNWFGLANPKHKVFDHTQALKLSRTVQAIKTNGCGVADADRYRDGDLSRLLRRAEQLAARLPLQTLTAQVPVDGNLGGFEMFVNGTTDLAPELYGWYGAPGIDTKKNTVLFLVGDHFSVTQTRVIAGNQEVLDKKMISRQVMQVTVSQQAIPIEGKHVQVNVATPYGVSQELLVPVLGAPKPTAAAPPAVAVPTAATVRYAKAGANTGDGRYAVNLADPAVAKGAVAWVKAKGSDQPATVTLTFQYRDCPLVIELSNVTSAGDAYLLDASKLTAIGAALTRRLNPFGPFSDDTNQLKGKWTTTEIVITPAGGRPAKADSQLELTFECSIP